MQENDLHPPMPGYLGANSVKDYLVLHPVTENLPPSVPFVSSAIPAKGTASHYIIRFLIIHVPSYGLDIRVLGVKSSIFVLQMSP